MSKNKIILILSLGIALVVIIGIWQYISSFHVITFNVSKDVTVNLYKVVDGKNQSTIKQISSSEKDSLQNGDYCVKPVDDATYNTTPICFTVTTKDSEVTVNPDYSKDHLASLLPSEISQINSVINTKYSAIINNYTLIEGQLYGRGEWYGTTLTQKVDPSDRGDVYRVLLEKKGDTWIIVAYPQIVLNKFDYPKVPSNILDSVNQLLGVS